MWLFLEIERGKRAFTNAGRTALRYGMTFGLIAAAALYYLEPTWVRDLSLTLAQHSIVKPFPNNPELTGILLISASLAWLIVIPVWWIKQQDLQAQDTSAA